MKITSEMVYVPLAAAPFVPHLSPIITAPTTVDGTPLSPSYRNCDDEYCSMSLGLTRRNSSSSSSKNSLFHKIYEEVQMMTKDTRLVPTLSIPRIGLIRTHDFLGVGTFSTVTCVSVVSERPRLSRKRCQQYPHHCHHHHYYDKQEDKHQTTTATATSTATANTAATTYYACKAVKEEFVCAGDRLGYINAVSQLAYEAHILSSLDHPNIIKLRGVSANGLDRFVLGQRGRTNTIIGNNNNSNGLFLLTDVLQETLDQRIDRWSRNPLLRQQQTSPPQQQQASTSDMDVHQRNINKYEICLQLASALEYLHGKNIVYRDLKPENIGFRKLDGSLQLFDFGLCRELPRTAPTSSFTNSQQKNDNKATTTGIIGTMRYMAPEVCMGYEYGTDCDIYSYAIVCWELWTERLPYENLSPESYLELVCIRGYRPTTNDDEPQQQEPPKEISVLLSQAWTSDPSSRCCWSIIRKQLQLFKKMEELRLELLSVYDGLQQ